MFTPSDIEAVKKIIAPIARKVLGSLARAMIKAASEEGLQIEILQDELRDKVPVFQHFGFKSVPLPDGEAVVIFLGGDRGTPVVIATKDKAFEPTGMEPGETVIFDNLGQMVYFKKDGTISVTANSLVDIDAPDVKMTGDLTVEGKIKATGAISSDAEVTALAIGPGVKLSTHMHATAVPGPASPPTPGT